MKKSIFGIVMVGMILGTTTVFGKTNVKPGMNNRVNDRMEVRVNNNGPRTEMGRPGMDKPMPEHRHEFCGPNHHCRICGITEHEWHMMMNKDMHRNPTPKPVSKTTHFGR